METERPHFVGGPEDGKVLEERFPPDHVLHGALPSVVKVPVGKEKHVYEYIGGDYIHQGRAR